MSVPARPAQKEELKIRAYNTCLVQSVTIFEKLFNIVTFYKHLTFSLTYIQKKRILILTLKKVFYFNCEAKNTKYEEKKLLS